MIDVAALVQEHVAAFNAHDTERVLAGLTEDAVWITGADTVRGKAALLDVFDDWLWALTPSLTILELVTSGDSAAAQLRETLTVDGVERSFPIAAFFRFDGHRISRAKVYREGSADLD